MLRWPKLIGGAIGAVSKWESRKYVFLLKIFAYVSRLGIIVSINKF